MSLWFGLSSLGWQGNSLAVAGSGISAVLIIWCVLVACSSLLGGWLPSLMRITHQRLQRIISAVGGFIVGVALFHQVPHAIHALGDGGVKNPVDLTMLWVVIGLVAMFVMLRVFHFHSHSHGEDDAGHAHDHGHSHDHSHNHDHGHNHDHAHDHAHCQSHSHSHDPHVTSAANAPDSQYADQNLLPIVSSAVVADTLLPVLDPSSSSATQAPVPPAAHDLSWVAMTFGLVIHTLVDGMALAAAVKTDQLHLPAGSLFGLGTFLAIALHKPLDSLSITSLMLAAGSPARWRTLVNFGYALMCPAGALLFVLGVEQLQGQQALIVGCALAFSAGSFLCIALADLLPEVQFHSHDRWQLTSLLIAGTIAAWGIGFLEPAHSHGNHDSHDHTGHDHTGHDHAHGSGEVQQLRLKVK
ncbi:zinc/iron permease [Planctopirus limnophila DSM 3776]|uniref:Zinc/iron permease n=1 Tax=Planctopirus limnophila (strain ATCC 43296 / DSM 3776 / IFAM 1008 / Mu 290) TaxID=521674 RepID=D5SV05_PLAL2|nr:ZIP family metal transporter [Planctopirus limnophila]ADG69291.1 zinc/iron permease [Planctopirus limnophila DSM 3776]